MSRVRIIGGGLSGILAAFEAHRLGARDIELHERFSQLGGSALPTERHGVELRERHIAFGAKDHPVRRRLEANGIEFAEYDNACGSVSPAEAGPPVYASGFAGPALPCADLALGPTPGPRLSDRIAAYPADVRAPLERWLRWRLGPAATEAHAGAAGALGLSQVLPLGADAAALAAARRADSRIDGYFAIPWAGAEPAVASTPAGGFAAFYRRCHRALRQIGVRIHENSYLAPRQILAEHRPGDLLVWTAGPAALFKLVDAPAPRLLETSHAAYVFAGRWTGPRPFRIENFTAEGVCIRVHAYESGERTLIAAECVAEAGATDLRYEVHRLFHGFEGDLALGELLSASVKPRWTHQTVAAIGALKDLRAHLAQRFGPSLVTNGWEHTDAAGRHAHLSGALAGLLAPGARRSAAA